MGDERAEMEAFCADAFPRLVGALALHTGDIHLAEELAQEALLRACRRWATVRSMESPAGWAYRVGINLASNRFRKARAERRAARRLEGQRPEAADATADVADVVTVRAAVAELTDLQRQAVILRFYFGMGSPQVAEVMDSTPGAVRALVHRAVSSLRERLGPSAEGLEEEVVDVP